MIGNRMEGVRLLKLWILATLSFLVFWGWFAVFFVLYSDAHPQFNRYALYSLVVLVGIVSERLFRRNSNAIAPAYQSHERSILITLRQAAFVAAAVVVTAFLLKDMVISRAFFLSYFVLLPIVLTLANRYILPSLTRLVFQGSRLQSTVLVGEPEEVQRNLDWFRRQRGLGLEVVGYVGSGRNGDSVEGIPRLGGRDDLKDALSRIKPSTAIFLDPPQACGGLIENKILGDSLGIRVVHIWDFQTHCGVIPILHTEAGMQFLGFLSEPLESPVNRLAKRLLDLAIAVPVCLFVLPPLGALVWLVHRFQSPGRLFFAQDRRGQGGRSFRMLKFRSMHENNPDESRQAARDDERVFAFGRLLRKTSIDEFPQFLNVLLGDMSIVGPRPHLADHDDRFATVFHGYHLRTFVKPGITGLAQVRGFRGLVESDSDVRLRAESDIQYLENWSLTLDASIILRTATKLLIPSRNAY